MPNADEPFPGTRLVKLPRGDLGIYQCGDPHGEAVLYFHGWPSSRLGASLFDEGGKRAGVRVIGVDRPGIGLSEPRPRRRIVDWGEDVRELADRLGLDRFAVIGVSGGGPYAAACARYLADRLSGCGLLSAVGPMDRGWKQTAGMRLTNRLIFHVLARSPALFRPVMWLNLGRLRNDRDAMAAKIDRMFRDLPAPDRQLVAGGRREKIAEMFCESFRQGVTGPAQEAWLQGRPWGFDLGEIRCPNVHVWHGELDRNVPLEMARRVAGKIPGCRFHGEEGVGEGHFSLVVKHAEAMLRSVTGKDGPSKSSKVPPP